MESHRYLNLVEVFSGQCWLICNIPLKQFKHNAPPPPKLNFPFEMWKLVWLDILIKTVLKYNLSFCPSPWQGKLCNNSDITSLGKKQKTWDPNLLKRKNICQQIKVIIPKIFFDGLTQWMDLYIHTDIISLASVLALVCVSLLCVIHTRKNKLTKQNRSSGRGDRQALNGTLCSNTPCSKWLSNTLGTVTSCHAHDWSGKHHVTMAA